MIDVAAAIAAVGVSILVLVAPIAVLPNESERVSEVLERLNARLGEQRKKRSAQPDSGTPTVNVVGLVRAIERRNRPSYGQRLVGTRRADATNGGPVRLRSAIVHFLVSELLGALVSYESVLVKEKRKERLLALIPELIALREKHAGNRTAVVGEAVRLMHEHKANPFTPLARTIGLRLAIHLIWVLVTPRRQSLPDLASGIATTTTCQRPSRRTRRIGVTSRPGPQP